MPEVKKKKSSKSFAKPTLPPPKKPTYEVPPWAGLPPAGMHLDVTKGDKLIDKRILDGKTHFFFGRQQKYIDFTLDHTSCSRVHAVMLYHQNLQRMFLIDLGSVHGTFLRHIQLEPNRPMQLAIEDTFHFGASTRTWTLREKPTTAADVSMNQSITGSEVSDGDGSLIGLPENENELDDLTEYNTAHNRRLAKLRMEEGPMPVNTLKRKRSSVRFDKNDVIINPEDIDPTVGRFRNLISMEIIIPNKKPKVAVTPDTTTPATPKSMQDFHGMGFQIYSETTAVETPPAPTIPTTTTNLMSMVSRITSAPDVEAPDMTPRPPPAPPAPKVTISQAAAETMAEADAKFDRPAKKMYVKEAWPGRKPKPQNNLFTV